MSANMEPSGPLRRKDTTRGPPLRILSLDGGGVRGYSMLIIIQEFMHRTFVETEGRAPRRHEIPKPADHFDLILGTGTGGLIAIMLGRLRLDLETCKEVYVRMTRKVFETDKTIAGIPYRSTLFKASKLEEAIRECVREHTVYAEEGNDADDAMEEPSKGRAVGVQRQSSNASVLSFSARSPASIGRIVAPSRWGNSNAVLYDDRETRTKTAVTAIYKGTPKGGSPALLRSYDSRKETAPEFNCSIWQAGRATSATGLAFKPIQIGQSVFIDEGAGKYNPSPVCLDEATVNEWPGREVGVFVSIGTGKRPAGSDANQHLWYEDFMGEFAEARKRLISKIEGCEETHQFMVKEYLGKRGVNTENYYRLNVEIGVGEFGMNEWNRLAEISTGTRRYLGKPEVQRMIHDGAAKMAKIYKARERLAGNASYAHSGSDLYDLPEANPLAVELPAEIPADYPTIRDPWGRSSYESGRRDSLAVPAPLRPSPRSSDEFERRNPNQMPHPNPNPNSSQILSTSQQRPQKQSSGPASSSSSLNNDDRFVVNAPTPGQYQNQTQAQRRQSPGNTNVRGNGRAPPPQPQHQDPPPIPPKTPIMETATQSFGRPAGGRGASGNVGNGSANVGTASRPPLPYPIDDGPPPVANMARKPEWKGR